MDQIKQLARLGLFDARVPRYTSYPTAPHFGASITPDDFARWIGAVPAGAQISLYLHVPFCRRLCWFCACRTQGTQSEAPVRAYVETLRHEIGLLKAHLAPGVTLSRLHWGGGTPTLMSAAMMTELAESIFDAVPMGRGGEFSVEIDPNEIDAERADALAAAGMNRASIGVQDFDPQIQQVIGREQSYEVTRAAADLLRARGIESLNADILFGLPGQTRAKIAQSVQMLLSLNPDRVALYGYAHVPWMARRQTMIPSDELPTPEERLALFETARALFVADGYDELGIDHFALPHDGLAKAARAGQMRRNFQGYTDDRSEVLIGLGASAISRFPQGYAQNAPATSAYTAAIRENRFSTSRGHAFTAEDRLRARMIEALMCDFRISTRDLTETLGADPHHVAELLSGCAAHFGNMVALTTEGLEIPEAARPLTRIIARHFDAYDMASQGHSTAI